MLPDGQFIALKGGRLLIGRMLRGHSQDACIGGGYLYISHFCLTRQHAVLTRMDDVNYAIADARNRSGTYVNGYQINDQAPLKAEDRINIGGLWITYCDETR